MRKKVSSHAELAKASYPRNRPWRSMGLLDVQDPTLSSQSAHRLSDLCTGRFLLPRNMIFFNVFGTHFC
jgi:hypothetical protein